MPEDEEVRLQRQLVVFVASGWKAWRAREQVSLWACEGSFIKVGSMVMCSRLLQ